MNSFTKIKIKSAKLGPLNPMPDIKNTGSVHASFKVGAGMDEEDTKYLGKGLVNTVAPYLMQDGYDRKLEDRFYKAVILENDKLKAIFLPEFGARLYSLFDKVHNKELLYINPVLQPCNFAIRDAWFSGGVEFNIGIKGHSNLTCEPMFTELIGDDAVRFYEYERVRGVAYSITAYLPKGAETLYVKMRIENTSDQPVYMYWWSNIAFPEKKDTRVIVPAKDAVLCSYQEGKDVVEKVPIPIIDGTDVSYPTRVSSAKDYFYKIPKDERKWIVAVDPDGTGLLQYSDELLRGRKLFLWGNNKGGRRWNEFLSEKGQAYIEIQAGLLTTQLEHIPMPKHTVWEWTEGYTYIDGADKGLYGQFDRAIDRVKEVFEQKIKEKKSIAPELLKDINIDGQVKPVMSASSWGGLENKVRKITGKNSISDTLKFDYVESEETEDFNHLLEKGYLPYHDTSYVPKAYINGKFWYDLIEWSLKVEEGNHWYAYLQLGVTAYIAGMVEKAENAFLNSVQKTPSIWAYRNLAMIYISEYGQVEKGLSYLEKALKLPNANSVYAFLKDVGRAFTEHGRDQEWLDVYQNLSDELKAMGRLKLYYAYALMNLNYLDKAKAIITPDFVLNDIREGESSITKLWQELYKKIYMQEYGVSEQDAKVNSIKKYPLPYELDYRMHD